MWNNITIDKKSHFVAYPKVLFVIFFFNFGKIEASAQQIGSHQHFGVRVGLELLHGVLAVLLFHLAMEGRSTAADLIQNQDFGRRKI